MRLHNTFASPRHLYFTFKNCSFFICNSDKKALSTHPTHVIAVNVWFHVETHSCSLAISLGVAKSCHTKVPEKCCQVSVNVNHAKLLIVPRIVFLGMYTFNLHKKINTLKHLCCTIPTNPLSSPLVSNRITKLSFSTSHVRHLTHSMRHFACNTLTRLSFSPPVDALCVCTIHLPHPGIFTLPSKTAVFFICNSDKKALSTHPTHVIAM